MLERVAGMLDIVSLLEECFNFNQTFLEQKMLVKHHLTCRLHVLTLLNQQMLYNNVRTCSRGLRQQCNIQESSEML